MYFFVILIQTVILHVHPEQRHKDICINMDVRYYFKPSNSLNEVEN